MQYTSAQLKGKIKSLSNKNNADARLVMRIYMMECFLKRLSISKYKENFVIKGGILVTSMVGIAKRSTMDIDATIKNISLSKEEIERIIKEIVSIQLNDNVSFEIMKTSNIMETMEYPEFRLELNAYMEKMVTPMTLDISTGDVITPRAINYNYKLLLEDSSIEIYSYNLETILAEKLQTILARGVLNTRLRDYYDCYTLILLYQERIDKDILREAFKATCKKRNSSYLYTDFSEILEAISKNTKLMDLWNHYVETYPYAAGISYDMVITNIKNLISWIM